jgi:hypothetical protein
MNFIEEALRNTQLYLSQDLAQMVWNYLGHPCREEKSCFECMSKASIIFHDLKQSLFLPGEAWCLSCGSSLTNAPDDFGQLELREWKDAKCRIKKWQKKQEAADYIIMGQSHPHLFFQKWHSAGVG